MSSYFPRTKARLRAHLLVVIIAKVFLLWVLWYLFIQPNQVTVDAQAMHSRLTGPDASASHPPPGDKP